MNTKRVSRSGVMAVVILLALVLPATARAATPTAATATAKAGPGKTAATAKPTAMTPKNAEVTATRSAEVTAPKATENDMTLKGGDEGTVFRTLTVEGEDRIHIEVERPALRLDMNPEKAPGLDWGTARDVLDRTTPDFGASLLASSAQVSSPLIARPWLDHFAQGDVARIRPSITGAERWKLTIVNARAEAVATFQGNGDPPREIAWDGRTTSGAAVIPGATYSYVFEARDKAGNKRNFVGEGFRVTAFRTDSEAGPQLVFAARELPAAVRGASDPVPPIVQEVATALNQGVASRPVRVEVTSRSAEEAGAIAARLTRWLTPLVIGDPTRLQAVTLVQPDAPEGGAVRIATAVR